jgi:hypothetical protein
MKKGKGGKYIAANGKSKIFETQKGSRTRIHPHFMGNNSLAALPVNNSRFCRYEKCQGISLPLNSRNRGYAYYVRKNNIRPLISSGYLSKKGVMEYDISYPVLCGDSLWNSFHGFENDCFIPEKRKFQSSILSYKINALLSRQSAKKIL